MVLASRGSFTMVSNMSREHSFWLFSAAMGLVVACLPLALPELAKVLSTALLIIGLLLMAVALFKFWKAKPDVERNATVSDDNRIQIGSVSGGQNRIGHEIHHHRPEQRHLTDEIKSAILKAMPNDRPVHVLGMNGNTESITYAREIFNFLKASGYELPEEDITWHMYFDPPVGRIGVSPFDSGKVWQVVVGPAE
jgi:hypothetical protein